MEGNSSTNQTQEDQELPVNFNPALFLERRGWVMGMLRREGVTELLDVGCAEGDLLGCLCNPAPWLGSPPPSLLLPPTLTGTPRSHYMAHEIRDDRVPEHDTVNGTDDDFIHLSSLHGLDISTEDLKYAIEEISPREPNANLPSWSARPRWEPLQAKIWEGSLDVHNPVFVGVECIVAAEVIEHLPEAVLQKFAPVLLGLYHPRLLLVTTPSYTFNQRFIAPHAPPGTRMGYPDPTKRTNRIFRHHDHKFEWTVQEFADWCREVADFWDYEVEIGGVGKPVEKDPWDREDELGFASQTAAFKRKEGEEYAERRAQRCLSLGLLHEVSRGEKHILLANRHHSVDPAARKGAPLHEIVDVIKKKMTEYRAGTIPFRDLWFENDLSILCGGWIEALVAAVTQCEDLDLSQVKTDNGYRWDVIFSAFVPRPPTPLLEEELPLEEERSDYEPDGSDQTWSDSWSTEAHPSWAQSDSDEWLSSKEEDWGAPAAGEQIISWA